MTPLEILRSARELISDPARWCTGELAKEKSGKAIEEITHATKACVWCAEGAWQQVTLDDERSSFVLLSDSARALGLMGPIHVINDGPDGHANVLRIYDHAIARLEAEEAARAG